MWHLPGGRGHSGARVVAPIEYHPRPGHSGYRYRTPDHCVIATVSDKHHTEILTLLGTLTRARGGDAQVREAVRPAGSAAPLRGPKGKEPFRQPPFSVPAKILSHAAHSRNSKETGAYNDFRVEVDKP